MGILVLVNNFGIFQLYVEVLIDRMQRPPDCEIVLQFHGHLLPHQLLEVGEEQLHHKIKSNEKRFKTSIPNKIEKLDRRDTRKVPSFLYKHQRRSADGGNDDHGGGGGAVTLRVISIREKRRGIKLNFEDDPANGPLT